MNVLGNILLNALAGKEGGGIIDWSSPMLQILQFIIFPIAICFIAVVMFSMYFLGESKSISRFGLSSKAVTMIKHTSLNVLIVMFGSLFFTFILWQLWFPLPYWGEQTFWITTLGMLLGISFGFMTFYTLYRRT